MKKAIIFVAASAVCNCAPRAENFQQGMVPAEAFSKALHSGKEFSVYRMNEQAQPDTVQRNSPSIGIAPAVSENGVASAGGIASTNAQKNDGREKWIAQGYELKKSVDVPSPTYVDYAKEVTDARARLGDTAAPYGPPPGSKAPYYQGQMTANPSLWQDEHNGESLFRDFRAYQPMDIITILINEKNEGKKKADSKAESKFDLLAGISNFFGIETRGWEENNPDLDPDALIQAQTNSKFDAKGETKREGSLKSRLSAVIMEVLPNGLLRVEGTKIVSMNSEEEIMVISGLVRTRDVDAQNSVDSSRVANMRIDFYGKGVLGDVQEPGWGYRVFKFIWPF